MKATEIRLGNFVYNEVQGIAVKANLKVIVDLLNGIEWQPIPLTKERLLSFGFKKDPDTDLEECFNSDCSFFVNNPKIPFIRIDLINGVLFFRTSENEYYPCPEYVHSFQNLYFALTGEELTTKL